MHKHQKGFALVVPIIIIVLLASATGYFVLSKRSKSIARQQVATTTSIDVAQTGTSLFERFPNLSNKGDLVVDGDFIWIANGAGLIRYNKKSGEQKIFTETDGLLANETSGVIKYKDEIWVTSQLRGISILDTKNNSWRYFTTANGLVDDGNLIIKLDGDVVWLATFDGFAKYDFKTSKWTNWKEGAGIKFAGVLDFVFNNNSVWIYVSPNAYTSGGALKLDKKTLTWTDVQNNNQLFSDRQLSYLYLDGDFFYAIAGKKIYRQNIISEQWDSFENNEINVSKFNIRASKHDNQYWAFNKDGNIEISGGLNSNRQTIHTDVLNQYCPTIKHSFNSSEMYGGYEKQFNFDGDILWFGCRQGVASYNVSNKTWNFKETISNYPAEIYNIVAVKNGTLLVDSNLGLGLAIPDKQRWTFIKSLEASDSLWGSAIWSGDDIYFIEILEAFGIGSPSQPPRLWKYNVLSKSTSQIKTPDDLSLSEMSEIIDVKINNNLWFNSGNEIQEFNPISGEVFSYKPTIEQGKYLTIKDIKKKDNVLWFVSNGGLGSFNLISKEFEIVGNPAGIKFPSGGLEHLVIVGNKIWTDAYDNPGDGLYIYDVISKTWEHLTQINSGLKFDWVRKLTGTTDRLLMTSSGKVDFSQRKRGDVSVITVAHTYVYEQYGLNIYDVVNNTWKFFTSEDGMLDGVIENEYVDGNTAWFVNSKDGVWKLNFDKLK